MEYSAGSRRGKRRGLAGALLRAGCRISAFLVETAPAFLREKARPIRMIEAKEKTETEWHFIKCPAPKAADLHWASE